MASEIQPTAADEKKLEMQYRGGGDTVYGLGLIGAWVFYIGRATTPEERVKGFFKGLVWPAFLVYELLKFLHPQE
jgi:hypothetical protein